MGCCTARERCVAAFVLSFQLVCIQIFPEQCKSSFRVSNPPKPHVVHLSKPILVSYCTGFGVTAQMDHVKLHFRGNGRQCTYSTELNSAKNYGRRCPTPLESASLIYTNINRQYLFITCSDRFPVPVGSAAKSANWCCQNLSKRALNALTVQASTTELGKLFQIFTMRAEKKNVFVSHREKNDFLIYSCYLLC